MKTIPSQPSTADFGGNVVASLGSFWTTFYQDVDLVKSYGGGSGLLAAQFYLNFLETAATLGKDELPVFHREQWHPIIIRKSRRDVGTNLRIVSGQQPLVTIGPQPLDTEYVPEKVYHVGAPASRFGQIGYETIIQGWESGIDRVMDQIVDPKTTLLRNVHFQIKADTITFLPDYDPFDDPNFPRRVVQDSETGAQDEEILLWGSHALTDKFYVRDHFGYAINLTETSTQLYQDRVSSLWNMRFGGTTLELFQESVGRMLGVPTIKGDGEVVEQVYIEANGDTSVVTNSNAYRCAPLESVLPSVVPGRHWIGGPLSPTRSGCTPSWTPQSSSLVTAGLSQSSSKTYPRCSCPRHSLVTTVPQEGSSPSGKKHQSLFTGMTATATRSCVSTLAGSRRISSCSGVRSGAGQSLLRKAWPTPSPSFSPARPRTSRRASVWELSTH